MISYIAPIRSNYSFTTLKLLKYTSKYCLPMKTPLRLIYLEAHLSSQRSYPWLCSVVGVTRFDFVVRNLTIL